MKAVVRTEYGSPDVIRVIDAPIPDPGPREVRVRVEAAVTLPAQPQMSSRGPRPLARRIRSRSALRRMKPSASAWL